MFQERLVVHLKHGGEKTARFQTTDSRHELHPDLGVGDGLQKAESVPEAFSSQAQFLLLLVNRGGALEDDFIILQKK